MKLRLCLAAAALQHSRTRIKSSAGKWSGSQHRISIVSPCQQKQYNSKAIKSLLCCRQVAYNFNYKLLFLSFIIKPCLEAPTLTDLLIDENENNCCLYLFCFNVHSSQFADIISCHWSPASSDRVQSQTEPGTETGLACYCSPGLRILGGQRTSASTGIKGQWQWTLL